MDISFPQVSVSLNSDIKMKGVTDKLYSPTTCSAVLVGGDQLSNFQKVQERINIMVEEMMKAPLAVILFVDEPLDTTKIQYQLNLPLVSHTIVLY